MAGTTDYGTETVKFGAVVGSGSFPLIWLEAAAERHRDGFDGIVAAAVTDEGYRNLEGKVEVTRVSLGQAAKVAKTLKKGGADNLTLMGKVEKSELLKGLKLDSGGVKILASTKDYSDVTLLASIVDYFESKGLAVFPQDKWLGHLLVEKGCLTKRKPDDEDWADIRYGLKMARAVAELEIGQTVVVRKRAVLAVEAIEGTDAAIERGGELTMGKGGTVAKAVKPGQDRRFDLPTVGLNTVKAMCEYGLRTLALDAGSTFLIEREAVIALANKDKMIIVGVSGDG
ncbi:MAG: LpxI family protein [bacterium]|nr:LpxI family protein [bacterium]